MSAAADSPIGGAVLRMACPEMPLDHPAMHPCPAAS